MKRPTPLFSLPILFIICGSLYNCSVKRQNKEFVLIKDLEIGEESGDERFVFSDIPSIGLDSDENIYILDRKNFRILKVDSNGNFLNIFEIEKGEGPGEVSLISSMAVTTKGKIFLFDRFARKVATYDESGDFLNSFPVEFYSTCVLPTMSENVIVLGLNDDHVFHEFSVTGKLLGSFGEPFEIPQELAEHSRLAHLRIPLRADASREGRLFLVSPHEYKINIFESKELKGTIEQTSEDFSPLELRVHDKATATVGMTFPLVTVLEHKDRLYVTLKKFGKDTTHSLHIFEKSKFIASLKVNGYAYAIDKMGRIYVSEEEEYPKMARYSVSEK